MTNTPPKPALLTFQLSHHDTRFILEALKMLEEKWQHINLTTTDEDEQAEYGMDAIDLHATRTSFESQAIAAFGRTITNFSREPFAPATVPNGEHPRPPR
jgi:hypothetical protein